MTEVSQELFDIVRDHGPLVLDAIVTRVTLLSDRSEIAKRLFQLKERGQILRRPDKTYVINGKNGAPPKTPPPPASDLPEALIEQLSPPARAAIAATGALPEPPPQAPAEERHEPPAITFSDRTPAAPPRTLRDVVAKHAPPPRPHDDLVHADPIEAVLREAVASAQLSLDAFVREAGDIAAVMANLIEARDKTVAALHHYRNKPA